MIQEKLNLKRDKYNIQEYNGSPTVQKFPHHFVQTFEYKILFKLCATVISSNVNRNQ